MQAKERIKSHFQEAQTTLETFLSQDSNFERIAAAGYLMVQALSSGGRIFSCGNGGSMCDAMHFAEELTGRYRNNRPALAAMALSDPSHLSCVSNDYGYDYVFSRSIEAFGRKGDVLLAISTSGNSKNVLLAMEMAKSKGLHVVGLTGKDGGKMASLVDVEIRAPHSQYADRAQEIHIKVIHSLMDYIESALGY
jgi:D-sedoheptulose 7-phosphate isomerase